MPKWDYAEVIEEWKGSFGGRFSKDEAAELASDGWSVPAERYRADRVSIWRILADPKQEPDWQAVSSLPKTIAQLGAWGFELVSYTEFYSERVGHKRWCFKRQVPDT